MTQSFVMLFLAAWRELDPSRWIDFKVRRENDA